MPEINAILGTSELHRIVDLVNQADGRQDWVSAAPPGYLYDAADAAAAHRPGAVRLREDRRGLRHGLHVLRDPAVPRPPPEPPARRHRGRGEGARARAGSRRRSWSRRTRSPTGAISAGNGDIGDLLLALSDTRCRGSGRCTCTPLTSPSGSSPSGQRARVVPYLDMPVQHGDDGVLRAMRRGVTAQRMKDIVAQLRDAIPGVTLRTTVLVGFPGRDRGRVREPARLRGGRGLRPARRVHVLGRRRAPPPPTWPIRSRPR